MRALSSADFTLTYCVRADAGVSASVLGTGCINRSAHMLLLTRNAYADCSCV
jgi:hypothetical protein